ncbi:MAG: hypothetical protein COU71_00275 [Parcubacteria group bacterium CG10_big_fil_rev_8_21_14_0_10_38_31]|nr:MAG: hypothetical protein COU71_00275 [Parcubacteria group bacterium CG10_big_fil_rev_8_21_14_0_10_38_31]
MKNRPSWDEIFMFQAISCATRHSCLKRGVGAVIVKDRKVVGTGYNGAAADIRSCRELGYCYYEHLASHEAETNEKKFSDVREIFKVYCQAVHAEANAMSQCAKEDAHGSTLYITNYPCPRCAQDVIITNKVKAVKVWKEYLMNFTLSMDEKRASDNKLLEAGISVNYIPISKERIKEIASYMACHVGDRTKYSFKGGK